MSRDVDVELGGPDRGRDLLDPICVVYDEVFSQPPSFWRDDESQLHRDRLQRLLADPTFGLAVALVGAELVGFAYGFALPPDSKRWERVTLTVPGEMTQEWPGRTFMLFDYAVREQHRGQGIGRALHDRLLGSRPEERATLSVEPTAVDSKAIYEHWGWQKVGEVAGGPLAAAPAFDVYLRDTLADLRTAGS